MFIMAYPVLVRGYQYIVMFPWTPIITHQDRKDMLHFKSISWQLWIKSFLIKSNSFLQLSQQDQVTDVTDLYYDLIMGIMVYIEDTSMHADVSG